MFKKKDIENPESEGIREGVTAATAATQEGESTAAAPAEPSTIGPSINISGDISGDEDVLVRGRLDGTVKLRRKRLTIGEQGYVSATVDAGVIDVEGQVEGDLRGEEHVLLQGSGRVVGNIIAPRVTLSDGCKFKGSIDMDVELKDDRDKERAGQGKITDIKPHHTGSTDT